MPPLTIALLAGGQSSRMGQDKAFVRVTHRPILEEIIEQVHGLADETVLVTNRPEAYQHLGLPLFGDVWPDKGALGGIYTALSVAAHPHVLCLACDMPFVSRPLLEWLCSLREAADVILPRLNGEAEPFRAVYAKAACLPPIHASLSENRMRIISFLGAVRVRYVDEPELQQFDPTLRSFFNINTPADLERARQLAAGV